MAAISPDHPRLLLLDLGGVLLHLNDPVETFGIGSSRSDFFKVWIMSPAVQAFESGAIGPGEFARRIVDDLDLPYTTEEFLQRFEAWPDRIPADTGTLLQTVPSHIDCAILSNTNALHWHKLDIERDLHGRVSRCFLSFETGLIKPDARAFRQVLEETGYTSSQVLFIDDNPINTAAAAQLGMRTRLCASVDALGRLLTAEGILAAASE